MKKIFLHIAVLALSLAFISCGSNDNKSFYEEFDSEVQSHDYAPEFEKSENREVDSDAQERHIIKNSNTRMMVEDVDKSGKEIDLLCKKHKAFISNSVTESFTYEYRKNLSIRVPAENFEALMDEILLLGTHINSSTISTSDVTKEYIDTEARLKNKKELEQRLIDLLKNRTTNLSDILEIERQLNDIRTEIEATQNYLNALKDQIQYSTIEVTIYQDIENSSFSKIESFKDGVVKSLNNGWWLIKGIILLIITLWPLLIIGLIIGFIAYFRIKKNKEKMKKYKNEYQANSTSDN